MNSLQPASNAAPPRGDRSALSAEIRLLIAHEGPISVARYMALALGHPVHGYYRTRDPLGAAGDFTTAPEISQMFGELLGLWAAAVWDQIGRPALLRFVELGPGRGTLMADALRAARALPSFAAALDVHLVETSPVLAAAQRRTLAGHRCSWHEGIETLPRGSAIILANEFFDALPVRQFVRADRGWCERLIGLDAAGDLAFGLAAEPERGLTMAAPAAAVCEVNPAGVAIMAAIAERIAREGGALLALDYGSAASGFGDTLQALRAHRAVDPLADPGEADLTAHVDFAALARAAGAAGAAAHGVVPQGSFLHALGLGERADALKRNASASQAAAIDAAVVRLAGPDPGMGELFKALAVTPRGAPAPPGFSSEPAP